VLAAVLEPVTGPCTSMSTAGVPSASCDPHTCASTRASTQLVCRQAGKIWFRRIRRHRLVSSASGKKRGTRHRNPNRAHHTQTHNTHHHLPSPIALLPNQFASSSIHSQSTSARAGPCSPASAPPCSPPVARPARSQRRQRSSRRGVSGLV
jgi:hypothetical protein